MNDDMLHPAVSSVPNSRLTCSQVERMIQDAIDGTLLAEDQTQFDLHIAGCPNCQRIYDDSLEGLSFLADLKIDPPEPPPLLLSRILAETSGNPQIAIPIRRGETIIAPLGRTDYPAGHLATVLPFQQPDRRKWPVRLVHAAMQPRFAMTAAMAFFSIALTMNLVGVSPRDFHASSLKLSSLRRGVRDVNNRIAHYYNGLRIVYELESRVNEIRQSDEDQRRSSKPEPARKDPDKPPSSDGSHSLATPVRPDSTHALTLPHCPNLLLVAASAAGNRGEGAPA